MTSPWVAMPTTVPSRRRRLRAAAAALPPTGKRVPAPATLTMVAGLAPAGYLPPEPSFSRSCAIARASRGSSVATERVATPADAATGCTTCTARRHGSTVPPAEFAMRRAETFRPPPPRAAVPPLHLLGGGNDATEGRADGGTAAEVTAPNAVPIAVTAVVGAECLEVILDTSTAVPVRRRIVGKQRASVSNAQSGEGCAPARALETAPLRAREPPDTGRRHCLTGGPPD